MASGRKGVLLRHYQMLFSIGTVGTLSDKSLLERYNRRDGEPADLAFAALVDRHGPMVLRTCRAILRDSQMADDAFQATFLVLVKRAGGLWIKDSIGPWLHEVASKTARSLRIAAIVRRGHEQNAAVKDEAVEAAPFDDLGALLHSEIDRLPERYRVVVLLCLLEGLTREQAAKHLGWPLGTVQSRLARGRERLQKTLIRRGVPPMFGIALTQSTFRSSTAAVPIGLFESTVRFALEFQTHQTSASRLVQTLFLLIETWKGTRMLIRLKTAAVLLTSAGLMTAAAGVLAQQGEKEEAKAPSKSVAKVNVDLEKAYKRRGWLRQPMPAYVVEPPDVLEIKVAADLPGHPISGEFLVRPDGRISLDYAGDILVAGLTTSEIKRQMIDHLRDFLDDEHLGLVEKDKDGVSRKIDPEKSKQVSVSVSTYNSKYYYVQGKVASPGRLPFTGNETVLDAINYAGGLNGDVTRIELVRPATSAEGTRIILPVDLDAIVKQGNVKTNYQILPGDRILALDDSDGPIAEVASNAVKTSAAKGRGNTTLEERLQAIERKLDRLIEAIDRLPAGR